ncbi:MAG: hypothetical protein QXS20_05790 [Candidatus Thorarchaeota archaeon]
MRDGTAVVIGDTGQAPVGLRVFFAWSDARPQDLGPQCGLSNIITRSGCLLDDPLAPYYAAKFFTIVETIGNINSPKYAFALRLLTPCGVHHFCRFEVLPRMSGGKSQIQPAYFTVFPITKHTSLAERIESAVEQAVNQATSDYFQLYGRADCDRWESMTQEVDNVYASVGDNRSDISEAKKYCMVLGAILRELFSSREMMALRH